MLVGICRKTVVAVALVACAASSLTHAQWGGGQSRWRDILDNPPDFYGSDESIRVAENVLLYQNDNGGWPKNIDMARKLSDSQKKQLAQDAQPQRNAHRQRRHLDANPLPRPDARKRPATSATPTPPPAASTICSKPNTRTAAGR